MCCYLYCNKVVKALQCGPIPQVNDMGRKADAEHALTTVQPALAKVAGCAIEHELIRTYLPRVICSDDIKHQCNG